MHKPAVVTLARRLTLRIACCFWAGHDPRRTPLGDFRCARCWYQAEDLEAFGFEGYVDPAWLRRKP